MRIEFFMPMIPPTITAQERKIAVKKNKSGKHVPVVYDPPEVLKAKAKLKSNLAKYQIEKPLNGPLRLITKWCFPNTAEHTDGEYKDTKPDTDNLQKMLKDIMENLKFYKNDAQVASEIIEKFWATIPGIYICLEEIYEKEL